MNTRYPSGLPRWKCRNGADQEALEAWTNRQLDLIDRQPASLIRHDQKMLHMVQAMLADKSLFERLLAAARAGRAQKRGPGRRKGECRPNDWTDDEINTLPYAAEDVIRIRAIWRFNFGKQNRGTRNPPTAIGIAAGRHSLTEERLRAIFKNHGRRDRGI